MKRILMAAIVATLGIAQLLRLALQLFFQPALLQQPRFHPPRQRVQRLRRFCLVGQHALHQTQRAGGVGGLACLGQCGGQKQRCLGRGVLRFAQPRDLARQLGGCQAQGAVCAGKHLPNPIGCRGGVRPGGCRVLQGFGRGCGWCSGGSRLNRGFGRRRLLSGRGDCLRRSRAAAGHP